MLVSFDPRPKSERLAETWRRLRNVGPFGCGFEAFAALCATVDAVEDEMIRDRIPGIVPVTKMGFEGMRKSTAMNQKHREARS